MKKGGEVKVFFTVEWQQINVEEMCQCAKIPDTNAMQEHGSLGFWYTDTIFPPLLN